MTVRGGNYTSASTAALMAALLTRPSPIYVDEVGQNYIWSSGSAIAADGTYVVAPSGGGPAGRWIVQPGINVTHVEDLDALKSLPIRPASIVVNTGRAAGTWQWDAGSVTTADDALVVQCTTGPAGRYKRIYDGVPWIEWFGGVVNDSSPTAKAANDAAFTAALATGLGINCPPGSIYFSDTGSFVVPRTSGGFGIFCSGADGPSGTVLVAGANSNDFLTFGDVGGSIQSPLLHNVQIDGSAKTGGVALTIIRANRGDFQNLRVTGGKRGIRIVGGLQISMRNMHVLEMTGAGSNGDYCWLFDGSTFTGAGFHFENIGCGALNDPDPPEAFWVDGQMNSIIGKFGAVFACKHCLHTTGASPALGPQDMRIYVSGTDSSFDLAYLFEAGDNINLDYPQASGGGTGDANGYYFGTNVGFVTIHGGHARSNAGPGLELHNSYTIIQGMGIARNGTSAPGTIPNILIGDEVNAVIIDNCRIGTAELDGTVVSGIASYGISVPAAAAGKVMVSSACDLAGNVIAAIDNPQYVVGHWTESTDGLLRLFGRMVHGSISAITVNGVDPYQQQHGTDANSAAKLMARWSPDFGAARIEVFKSRGVAVGDYAIVSSGDDIVDIRASAANGVTAIQCARLRAEISNTPGAADMPTQWVFSTTPDGTTALTDVLRIGQDGSALTLTPSGRGWATGGGGAVTQQTSKSTAVDLNTPCGQITMNNANLNAGASVSFTFNNSKIAATDVMNLTHAGGGNLGDYAFTYRCAAGSATIRVTNTTGGNLAEAVVIGFSVTKVVTS